MSDELLADVLGGREKPITATSDSEVNFGQSTRGKLREFVARVERLEAEEQELREDKKEVWAEAKAFGFDVKVLKKIVADRKKDAAELAEEEALYDLYLDAVED